MKLILTFFAFTAICFMAKADTIDFWHVYYNNAKILSYNILLKTINIHKTDSITVKYFRDTPCEDCKTSIFVEDKNHNIVVQRCGKGTSNPITIYIYDILADHLKTHNRTYWMMYAEDGRNSMLSPQSIFKITLE